MTVDFSYLDQSSLSVFGDQVTFGYGSNFARQVTAIVDSFTADDPETGMTAVATEISLEPNSDYVPGSYWVVAGTLYSQAAPAEPDGTLVKISLVRKNAQP